MRGLGGPDAASVYEAIAAALKDAPGVIGTFPEPVFGRVVVGFDPAVTTPSALIAVVGTVEHELGLGDVRFPLAQLEHPCDSQVADRQLLALAANGVGLGLSLSGRILRVTPLPVELASVFTLIDNEPRVRQLMEARVGTAATDVTLAVGNALGQGLAQGPLGLITDSVHRLNLLVERAALRGSFERAEDAQWDHEAPTVRPTTLSAFLAPRPARPRPLPLGPVERYADRAGLASVATTAATHVATGSPRRAAAVGLAGVPKAGRMGRDAFAAHLARSLAARDVIVLDPSALRRLDRVDTVVVDGELADTAHWAITGVRIVDEVDTAVMHRALARLFRSHDPQRPARHDSWRLAPLLARERRTSVVRRLEPPLPAGERLALHYQDRLVAVVSSERELSAESQQVIQAARRQGHMVVFVGDEHAGERLGADLVLDGSPGLSEAVAGLQADGCVVALIARGGWRNAAALRRADVGLEIAAVDASPWSGDLILDELGDSLYIVEAIACAHEVSRQGVALALSGSALGALVAVGGTAATAATRAARAVNIAALAAMANGVRVARALNRNGGMVVAPGTDWHLLETDEVLRRLSSSPEGLSDAEVQARHSETTAATRPPSLWRSVTAELINPLTPVLAGGAVASAAVGSITDAAMVAGVTVLNALIGGVQRFGAERAVHELGRVSDHPVNAVRAGAWTEVASDTLVPGDVVMLQSGDAVAADCRILDAQDLEVDESALTGESQPVSKDPAPLFSSVLAERSSMLYEGTTIVAGTAMAVVVAVGSDTVATRMGDIGEATHAEGVEGRLRRLTSVTLPVSLAGGAAMLASGLVRRQPLNQSVGSSVALAVAAVPEGLPLLATMAQLASARRLSQRGALVRNARAVEALGRVGVLCTDKTGTLTEGRIRLVAISDGSREADLDKLDGRRATILAAALRASPPPSENGSLPHLTDQAVLDGGASAGVAADVGRPGWSRGAELPFEPARGYHAVIGRSEQRALLSVKGAPEVVLPRCLHWASVDGPTLLESKQRAVVTRRLERLAARGLRVLAVAERELDDGVDEAINEDPKELTLLGFLALSDPVRATAAEAVKGLRRAGVEVVMVTGDHPLTARGIAVELDILNGHRTVTGAELAEMDDAALDRIVNDISVFARVTPADKVRIVAALQRKGRAVAMTGDGANDAPAIRLADAGIALGVRSTAAAREAADLVVTDDRIETIVDAIVEGRAMWSSVREALAILLGGNLGEVAFTVVSTLVTGRTPLSARQLLAVNLLTDVAPALAIAVRPPPGRTPEQLIEEGPDVSLGRSLEQAIAIRAATTASGAAIAWVIGSLTGGPRRASTMALVALVGSQLGQTIVGGGLDPLVLAAGGGSALVLAGIVQTPGVSQLFGCTPLDPVAWVVAFCAAAGATGASALGSWLAAQRSAPPRSIAPAVPAPLELEPPG